MSTMACYNHLTRIQHESAPSMHIKMGKRVVSIITCHDKMLNALILFNLKDK